MKLVVATGNRDKLCEIREILRDVPVDLLAMEDTDASGLEVEETGATLEENALLKARAVAAASGLPAIADDTGLEVDALGGAPGVISARYAGESATYADNCRKLLGALTGDAARRARFRTVVALALPEGSADTVDGACPGVITETPRGTGGFGYDPIFLPDGKDHTFAELSIEEKNAISHRGRAFRASRWLIARMLFD